MKKDNVVSFEEKKGEREFAEEQKQRYDMVEWETNVLMRSIYETLLKLENPRQAIAAGMAMITVGKDLLLLELGENAARAVIEDMKFDTAELIQAERVHDREPPPENDGGDEEGSRQWTEQELRAMKSATSSIETDVKSEDGE